MAFFWFNEMKKILLFRLATIIDCCDFSIHDKEVSKNKFEINRSGFCSDRTIHF